MQAKHRRKVALLIESSRSYGRDLLRGAALYARTRTDWALLHQEMTIDAAPPDWLETSSVAGIIARVDRHTIEQLRGLKVPLVDVRCARGFSGVPRVNTDNRLVSKLAFQHLWDRGFRRFAFCGFQFAHYSVERLDSFRQAVADAGCPLSAYESASQPNATISSIEESGLVDVDRMGAWLMSLKRPTGLFVCNDIRGQQVLSVCLTLGIAVPDDMGVIGVDDDDTICPLTDPPLTSVRPNAERVGHRAAEILDELMDGIQGHESIETVPPIDVVQRLSSEVKAVGDKELARVCRFIRDHACDGITVNDVVGFTRLSRRQLERRFRTYLGHTPHDEITAVQLARVKQLLCETKMTLEQIAPLAGYSYKERLSAVFKRETGKTPGEYRRQHS